MTDSPDTPQPEPFAAPGGEPLVNPPARPAHYPPVVAPPPRTEGKAVAALVCAILSWFVVPIVLAVVALVLARSAERAIEARPAELSGTGLVKGARWVAWVHLVLAAMVVAFSSAFVIALWIGR